MRIQTDLSNNVWLELTESRRRKTAAPTQEPMAAIPNGPQPVTHPKPETESDRGFAAKEYIGMVHYPPFQIMRQMEHLMAMPSPRASRAPEAAGENPFPETLGDSSRPSSPPMPGGGKGTEENGADETIQNHTSS